MLERLGKLWERVGTFSDGLGTFWARVGNRERVGNVEGAYVDVFWARAFCGCLGSVGNVLRTLTSVRERLGIFWGRFGSGSVLDVCGNVLERFGSVWDVLGTFPRVSGLFGGALERRWRVPFGSV